MCEGGCIQALRNLYFYEVCVCVCSVCAHACEFFRLVYTARSEEDIRCHSLPSTPRQGLLLAPELADLGNPRGSVLVSIPGFHMGTGDLNPDLYACAANAFTC